MTNSFNTSKATVRIVETEILSNKREKQIYKNIATFRDALVQAKKNADNSLISAYQQEIKDNRAILRKLRSQEYLIEVYLKRYKFKCKVAVDYEFTENRKTDFKDMIEAAIDKAITKARAKLRLEPFVTKLGTILCMKIGSKQHGYVYQDEGVILKAHIQKNAKIIYDGKTPTLPRKYIGIELEFCAAIKEDTLVSKLFQKGIHKFAQLKQDGSLRPHEKEYGYELAILLEENNYKKDLKKVTEVLESIKATSKDRRCGFHVHLDMRRRNKDLVYNNLVACQYALLSIVDPVRYNNEFCQTVNTRKFPTEFTGDRQERYKTINAAAYYKYRTLEVRMHEGSVDYSTIVHWVDLLVKLSNHPKKMKQDVTKLSTLHQRLKLTKKLYNYALDRSCSWQIQNNDSTQEMRNSINSLRSQANRLVQITNTMVEVSRPRISIPLSWALHTPVVPRPTYQEMLDNQPQPPHNEDEGDR